MQDKYPKQLSGYEYAFQNDHTYEDEAMRIEAHPDYTKDGITLERGFARRHNLILVIS